MQKPNAIGWFDLYGFLRDCLSEKASGNYYLVCLKSALDSAAVGALRDALSSRRWEQAVSGLTGYAPPPQMGQVLSLTRALPWWHFDEPA